MPQTELVVKVEYEYGDEVFVDDGITILKTLKPAGQLEETNFFFNCYPNPSSGITYFDITLAEKSDIVLKIYDLTGILLSKMVNKDVSGKHQITFDSSNLSDGRYNYAIVINGASHSGSFMKIK